MRVRRSIWMPGLFAVIALVIVACGSDATARRDPEGERLGADRTTLSVFRLFLDIYRNFTGLLTASDASYYK